MAFVNRIFVALQTKAFDQKTTVLQCVVRTMRATTPESLEVASELSAISPATKLPLDVITAEVASLRNQFIAVQDFVCRLSTTACSAGNERYCSIKAFLERAEVHASGFVDFFTDFRSTVELFSMCPTPGRTVWPHSTAAFPA